MNATANRMLILLEVDGKLKQVVLSDKKKEMILHMIDSVCDGPIKVFDEELPIKLEDNETDS